MLNLWKKVSELFLAKKRLRTSDYSLQVVNHFVHGILGIEGTLDSTKSHLLYPYCLIQVKNKQLVISINLNFNFSVNIGILSRELQKLGYDFYFTHGFWVLNANLIFDDTKLHPVTRQVLALTTTERTFVSRAFGDN